MRTPLSVLVGLVAAVAFLALLYAANDANPIRLAGSDTPGAWWWPTADSPPRFVPFARPFRGPALRRTQDGRDIVVVAASLRDGPNGDRATPPQRFDPVAARFELLAAPPPVDEPPKEHRSVAVSRGGWLDLEEVGPTGYGLVESGPRLPRPHHFPLRPGVPLLAAAALPDGRRALLGFEQHDVVVLQLVSNASDAPTSVPLHPAPEGSPVAVTAAGTGRILFVVNGAKDLETHFADLATGSVSAAPPLPPASMNHKVMDTSVVYGDDGSMLLTVTSQELHDAIAPRGALVFLGNAGLALLLFAGLGQGIRRGWLTPGALVAGMVLSVALLVATVAWALLTGAGWH